jgi:hypothetical protein
MNEEQILNNIKEINDNLLLDPEVMRNVESFVYVYNSVKDRINDDTLKRIVLSLLANLLLSKKIMIIK